MDITKFPSTHSLNLTFLSIVYNEHLYQDQCWQSIEVGYKRICLLHRLSKQLEEAKVKIDKSQTDIQSREANLESLVPKLGKILEVCALTRDTLVLVMTFSGRSVVLCLVTFRAHSTFDVVLRCRGISDSLALV